MILTLLLVFCILCLLLYLLILRHSIREAAEELNDKLQTDTNTLISISSGDRAMKALTAQINNQLQALRKERLKLQHGDMELKSAITGISHDLRTPLTAMCGYLDLLEQEPLSDNAQRYLAVLRERTDSMRNMTEELLQYSVVTSSADDPDITYVCLNDILEQSLAGLYGALAARGIVPIIDIPEQKITRTLDKNALRRIFDNILSNAVKYSDGDLSVRLSPDGTVKFKNRSKELDSVQAAHLFDRFFTVNNSRGGTGLGLSIAKQLTEKMNGQLTAEYLGGNLSVCVQFKD